MAAIVPIPATQDRANGNEKVPRKTLAETVEGFPEDLRKFQLRYKLAQPTVKLLATIPKCPSRRNILEKACFATEFRTFPIRDSERSFFRHVNDHMPIPYQVNETICEPWHKVFMLLQLDLLHEPWPNKISVNGRKALHSDRGRIYIVLDKVLRCLADILGARQDGRGVSVALDVLRSTKAGVWEGSSKELLQVEGLGMKTMEKLNKAGVKTIKQLKRLEFFHIERLLSRNPPFGHNMLHQLEDFPVLNMKVEFLGWHQQEPLGPRGKPANMAIHITRVNLLTENQIPPVWKKQSLWASLVIEGSDDRLVMFWRGSLRKLVGGKELVFGLEISEAEELKMTFACEAIVGTLVRRTLTARNLYA